MSKTVECPKLPILPSEAILLDEVPPAADAPCRLAALALGALMGDQQSSFAEPRFESAI